jgi:8-oxo-dGTP pyrophosphatase MutT (NUDIX family)
MTWRDGTGQPARTVLEQKIRERRLSLREFVEFVETFARDHNEPGTLSFRHLQRLAAGRQADGVPLGPLRPATARLLERVFDVSIDELLSAPSNEPGSDRAVHIGAHRLGERPHPLIVAVAVVTREAEVLVVCRRSTEESGITWQFPAGMVKPGAHPHYVAIRETLRETGVHCSPSESLGRRVHPVTNVICEYWLCDYVAGEAHNVDAEENISVTWIHREKLPRIIPSDQIFPPVLKVLDLVAG